MKPKKGLYFYTLGGRSGWHIFRYTEVTDKFCMAEPVDEPIFYDKEKARQRVYELNGWNDHKCPSHENA